MRKAKSCYNCIAHSVNNIGYNNAICLLGYDMVYNNQTGLYSPKECCHKPKSVKELVKRLRKQ